jgi:hypothetical protein
MRISGYKLFEVTALKQQALKKIGNLKPDKDFACLPQPTNKIESATAMEVHHHPDVHHKKKKFREYFLEFLMIFLAVTMGFFAESIRETIADHSKEKEFIQSMIEDAQTDTVNFHVAISKNTRRMLALDSLSALCANYDPAKRNDSVLYRLYRVGLIHPDIVSPTERTLLQLKNSGGMRLIKKKTAVDNIILYDDAAKKLADQQAYYERYQNESVVMGLQVFNFEFFKFGAISSKREFTDVRLLSQDKIKLIQFANCIAIYTGVVNFYNTRLQEMDDHAISLIQNLKKEYHFGSE